MKEGRDRDDEIKHEGPNGDDRKGPLFPTSQTIGQAHHFRMEKLRLEVPPLTHY